MRRDEGECLGRLFAEAGDQPRVGPGHVAKQAVERRVRGRVCHVVQPTCEGSAGPRRSGAGHPGHVIDQKHRAADITGTARWETLGEPSDDDHLPRGATYGFNLQWRDDANHESGRDGPSLGEPVLAEVWSRGVEDAGARAERQHVGIAAHVGEGAIW